jgi:anti-sigma B factor antagonist
MSLEISKRFDEEKSIWDIQLVGDVDIQSSNQLKEEINGMLNEIETDLMIDCASLSYIDSTGLGVLIGVLKRVRKVEKEITIINAQNNIKKLLGITGLDKIFKIR